jgi:hypothetical protein
MSLSYHTHPVYLKTALVTLGIYGLTHEHSHAWVPAVTCLIQRRGWMHA